MSTLAESLLLPLKVAVCPAPQERSTLLPPFIYAHFSGTRNPLPASTVITSSLSHCDPQLLRDDSQRLVVPCRFVAFLSNPVVSLTSTPTSRCSSRMGFSTNQERVPMRILQAVIPACFLSVGVCRRVARSSFISQRIRIRAERHAREDKTQSQINAASSRNLEIAAVVVVGHVTTAQRS